MMLLVCFDLPRNSKEYRYQAYRYRKKLIEMGFTMKQFSLYEREIKQNRNIEKIIQILKEKLPDEGQITLYLLPDYVNDTQINILGNKAVKKTIRKAAFVVM